MFPKILQRVGLVACLVLVIACFMPWTYHEDLKESFTGFYSHENFYGKPGRFLTIIAVIAFALMYLPKIWAKRTNLFVCALGVGYAIKSYILFTSCYNAYCPEKKAGIYLMLVASVVMLVASAFPDLKLKDKKSTEKLV
ncbi:MAG TPA: hypothetical protein PLZ68_14655 [Ferruginibacter sp.]|nr:hypothetical protein [Ferruginibacter sp.]